MRQVARGKSLRRYPERSHGQSSGHQFSLNGNGPSGGGITQGVVNQVVEDTPNPLHIHNDRVNTGGGMAGKHDILFVQPARRNFPGYPK